MNYAEFPLVPPNRKHENFNWKFLFFFFFYIPTASELQQIRGLHTHVRIVRTSCGHHGVEEER